jgi:(E)-4-hydroxy-3-methylbut-2-enyl-diphosphate synthase
VKRASRAQEVVEPAGEAGETDMDPTGGGNGTDQVYPSGLTDHCLKDADIVEHPVELVEKEAAEIEAARRADPAPARSAAPQLQSA